MSSVFRGFEKWLMNVDDTVGTRPAIHHNTSMHSIVCGSMSEIFRAGGQESLHTIPPPLVGLGV